MKKHVVFFLILCSAVNTFAASSDEFPPDSVVMQNINERVMQFLDSYTLSDINGNYSLHYDSLFFTLFSDNARIYNFLPGTVNYLRNIPIDNYQKNIRNLQRDVIIQPGLPTYSIYITADSRDKGFVSYQAEVITDVILFSRRFDRIADIDLHLLVSIEADLVQEKYKISQVADASPALVDLEFRFLDTNRNPISAFPVVFSYSEGSNKHVLSRIRHTDPNGWLKFSYVPADKNLDIAVPKGYSLLLNNSFTADQWKRIPSAERLIFVSRDLNFIRKKFFAEFGIWRQTSMHNTLKKQARGFVSHNQDFNFQAKNSFYLDFSYNVFQKNRHQFLIGSGIEYFNTSFQLTADSVSQNMTPFYDQAGDGNVFVLRANDILESYSFQSYALPFFVTYRYQTRNRYIPAIDLSAKALYFFSKQLSYDVMLEHETIETRNQHGLAFAHADWHAGQSGLFAEHDPLHGKMENSQRFALSAHLAVNITLVDGYLWLQPRIMYHFSQFGNKPNSSLDPNNNFSKYNYRPSFSHTSYYKGFVNYGLGLLFGL